MKIRARLIIMLLAAAWFILPTRADEPVTQPQQVAQRYLSLPDSALVSDAWRPAQSKKNVAHHQFAVLAAVPEQNKIDSTVLPSVKGQDFKEDFDSTGRGWLLIGSGPYMAG